MSTNDFQPNTTNPYIRVYGLTKKEIIRKTALTLSVWMIIWHTICYFVHTPDENSWTTAESLVMYFIFTSLVLCLYFISTFSRYFSRIVVDSENVSINLFGKPGGSYPIKFFSSMKKANIIANGFFLGTWYELHFIIPSKGTDTMPVPPMQKDILNAMQNDIISMQSFGTFTPEKSSFLDNFSLTPDYNDENTNKYVPLKIDQNRLVLCRKSLLSFNFKLFIFFYVLIILLGILFFWLLDFNNESILIQILFAGTLLSGPLLIHLNDRRIILTSMKTIPAVISLSMAGIRVDTRLFPLKQIEKIQITSPIDPRMKFNYTRMLNIYSNGQKQAYLIGDARDKHNIAFNNQYLFYYEAIYQFCHEYNIIFEEEMEDCGVC